MTTWDDLEKAFLTKYFPPSKSMKLRTYIITFAQGEHESLCEAWEPYTDLLRRCPHHKLCDWLVQQIFYYGLPHANRTMLDAAAARNLLRKSPEEGCVLIKEMTSRSYHPQSERNVMRKSTKDRQYGNQNYGKQHQEEKSSMEKMMQKFISSTETRMKNQDASIKNLENQIGQLTKAMSGRDPGTLPSDTEKNHKEQVKAIELRGGKRIETERQESKEPEVVSIPEKTAGKSSNSTPPPTSQLNFVIPPPFAAALKKTKLDAQLEKFLEVFKNLNINIPFADALMQMPSYAKFLKEILSNKRKLEEHALASLKENFSALVQNKIPSRQKDPGSFSIPCMISDVNFQKALCDLGASINLMPYSIFRKLGLGESKPTRMSLQLADRSLKYPRGIIEDVLVKVDKFIFPVDFVVLDMEEDLDMALILGRPFLATGKTLLDVQKGELLLRDTFQEPLEAALASPYHEGEIHIGKQEMTAYLNDNQPWKKGVKLRIKDLDTTKAKLLDVLKNHKSVFAWKVSYIKGINSSICMHKILMEKENINPLVQPQRRLNTKMQEVVKAETIKLLGADIIYPISDSAWVSPVECVLKKGGITVIQNEHNGLIPIRTVTGWRVCIYYRKLNDATRKNHFPLPFIDQMLERLAGYEFYSFLDGYSEYNQILIAPKDRDKTTFTCPYGTFAYTRMPFGLCNAPATFQRCMTAIFNDMAFETLRERLVTAPVLTSPNWDLAFEVMCDTSDSAVGVVLGQRIDKNDTEEIDDWFPNEKLFAIENSSWYANFENYLDTGTLPHNLSFHQKKKFMSDVKHYFLEEPFLFKICADSMIRRCVAEVEMRNILSHCHDREVGGHAGPIKTATKVLECGFYWPSIFKYARSYVIACDRCQRTGEKRLLELNQLEEFRDHAYDMAVSYK
ncbi:uncharacterized protein [Henckelia pumila]|uniref:uncharacterized protein n=1 Tax=Henckelia pumila TaxID=405737 RepID=UPI003C6E3908